MLKSTGPGVADWAWLLSEPVVRSTQRPRVASEHAPAGSRAAADWEEHVSCLLQRQGAVAATVSVSDGDANAPLPKSVPLQPATTADAAVLLAKYARALAGERRVAASRAAFVAACHLEPPAGTAFTVTRPLQ